MNKIYRIVLTGGPCGGKTTAMSLITDRLRSLGFNVYVIPEVATMMILGGLQLVPPGPEGVLQMQTCLLNVQLELERTFLRGATISNKPSVILCDRGAMDGSAFVSPDAWQAMLDENGWSTIGLRDKHYDAVIHLVTAAVGATEAYTLSNNLARSEAPELAAEIDRKIQEAWVGHPHLRVIDNSTDFPEKIRRVIASICNVVGVPEPVERERKFLVSHHRGFGSLKHETVDIEQTYLICSDGIGRVRRRGQHGHYTYTHTVKKYLGPGENIELERMISGREYLTLLSQADPERVTIKKHRTCFLWDHQYFELDLFLSPREGLVILEAELDEKDKEVKLPPFLKIEREVTNEPEFANAEIARIHGG